MPNCQNIKNFVTSDNYNQYIRKKVKLFTFFVWEPKNILKREISYPMFMANLNELKKKYCLEALRVLS